MKVDIGQKAGVQLPDGTQIWLNSASSLTYDTEYNQKDRIVYLQGEAYFEVSSDKEKPFIVKTDDVSVEALGTSFNVKAYPDDDYVTATLIEGSVKVSSPFQSDLLKPNEKLAFSKNKQQFTKTVLLDAERNISWKNNYLAFEQENLEDIAKVLERMYNVQIQFTSEKLKHIRFSGTITNNNLESVLQLIMLVSPIRYSIEKDSVIIIKESPR
jgi:ferric-dicitrate binding protein FerR (iron transport regulator)